MSDSDEDKGNHDNQPVEDSSENLRKKDVWYYNLEVFLNHIREINVSLIFVLGTCLLLDEMKIQFSDRSNETHHIKNKPIQEGYKFFALMTTEGCFVNFNPDGRSDAKSGRQECEMDKTQEKVEGM
eukprot:10874812-Ditylum_brightwellii.AAC.1